MTLKDRINDDVKEAMRSRDKEKLGTLRMVTAAIKQVEIDERIVVEDDRLVTILNKLVKQRKESISQFQAANRLDLVAQEEYELGIINQYLPEPLSEQAITDLINQAITELGATKIADMGKVMNQLRPILTGRADMSAVSALIKAKLS